MTESSIQMITNVYDCESTGKLTAGLPDTACGVPEPLEDVLQHLAATQRHAEGVCAVEDVLRNVRRRLEDVRPDLR